MNDAPPIPSAPVTAARRRISGIWIVPIVAVLLGGWLVWQHYTSKGPLAIVRFETAAGVTAGKTKVQRRSVDIGIVESVRLSEDLTGVVMGLRIDADATELLREDTQFWVVRPRVGGAGISGLGTIVSGAYLEIDPGVSTVPKSEFGGLEQPPVTPQGVPGLRLRLIADEAGSLGPGASVVYRGITVGRIEELDFEYENNRVIFDAFIEEEYSTLVRANSRFWNTTGFDMELSAEGIRVSTGSLDSLITGSVEFDTLPGTDAPEAVEGGAVFTLHRSRRTVDEVALEPGLPYLLMFKDSVRGLSKDAAVEFRGLKVGAVTGISFDYAPNDPEKRVPVLVRIDPSALGDAELSDDLDGEKLIEANVARGLRASLKTGSLLTGKLFVNLTLEEDAPPAEVGREGRYRTLPTMTSGLALLEDKLVSVLDKLEALPVEDTLTSATAALAQIEEAAKTLRAATAEVETLLASEGIQNLPARIDAALLGLDTTMAGFQPESVFYRDLTGATEELRQSLRSIRVLADSIERKPNSLIFGRSGGKVKPPAAKP